MKIETLLNLLGTCLFGLLGLGALVGAVFFGAWWHFVTAVGCALMAFVLYKDDDYGIESVASYFKCIKSK